MEESIKDILPQSLNVSPMTGRLLYMDKAGILYQYDISNKKKLKKINISSRVPLNKCEIIDVLFNPTNSSFYTLNKNWVLEVW
jgi:hypothetical protein